MSGSGTMNEDTVKQELADCNNTMKSNADTAGPTDDLKDSNTHDENVMPSPREEEEMIKKKYGGLLPQKLPLISKDHERAFFDSADWALGKQGAQKPKGPLEALRPKLQPTPHQQLRSRRSAYAPADDNEGDGEHNEVPEDKSHKLEDGSGEDIASDERGCRDQLHDAP